MAAKSTVDNLKGDVELVYTSFKAAMSCDAEVNCKRDDPGSLTTVADLFPAGDNDALSDFCTKLLKAMCSILSAEGQVKPKALQEQSLVKFHRLKLEKLPLIWQSLSAGLELPPVNPFQQQAVNRHLFQRLVINVAKSRKPAVASRTHRSQLTTEEDNAIRYVRGYVAILNKYRKLESANAVHFVKCLSNMASLGEESSYYEYTLEWLVNIDRGGLFYINDSTFSFFKAIEIKTQGLLPKNLAARGDVLDKSKNDLIQIVDDEDVEFLWSVLSIDIPDEAGAAKLLNDIVNMWETIRGFAVVSNWLEQYKIAQKHTVKKSKRLRKKLQEWIPEAYFCLQCMQGHLSVRSWLRRSNSTHVLRNDQNYAPCCANLAQRAM